VVTGWWYGVNWNVRGRSRFESTRQSFAWSYRGKPWLTSVLDQAMDVSKSQPEPKQGDLSSTGIDFLTLFTWKGNTSVFLISCVSTLSFCPLLLRFSQSLTFTGPRGLVIFAFSLLDISHTTTIWNWNQDRW